MIRHATHHHVKIRRAYLNQAVLSHLQLALICIGSLFWIEAATTGQAFSAEVYGNFALRFPAEFWAANMMAGSALTWVGLRHPVKRWMVAVGAALQLAQYLGLGYSAIVTGGELVIGFHCTALFAPLYARILWEALSA